jgi:hypothetical protein
MSEQQPHMEPLDQQFQNLPLPDEQAAWVDMKRMLDKDRDDRVVLPFFLKGCAGWIVLIGLITALIFIVRPDRWWQQDEQRTEQSKQDPSRRDPGSAPVAADKPSGKQNRQPVVSKDGDSIRKETETKEFSGTDPLNSDASTQIIKPQDPSAMKEGNPGDPPRGITNRQKPEYRPGFNAGTSSNPSSNQTVQPQRKRKQTASSVTGRKEQVPSNKKRPPVEKIGTSQSSPDGSNELNGEPSVPLPADTAVKVNIAPDTPTIKKSDTTIKKILVDSTVKKPDPAKPKKPVYYFAAGVAVQQQIPFAGQKAVPYNYYGRKGSIADYLPSVYARYYKEGKWFIQSEFRYGAPQSVRELSYSIEARQDTFGSVQTIRSQRLKKTFYHQVPVSFNYYVLPNLSLGGGLMYSKFYGAVTEDEVKERNLQTNSEQIISKQVVRISNATDSFFTKTQMHLLVETQYSWKRLSLGLRYTFGLNPYIRYTDTAGELKEEKARTLQAFLRFQVWRSHKN